MEIDSEKYWNFLGNLVGTWTSNISGKAGKGKGTSVYSRVLQSNYIKVENRAEFPSQEKNPNGEIHEDWGYFSFDKVNHKGILRVFYSEGYVTKYELIRNEPAILEFESVQQENLPRKFLAKITLHMDNESELSEKLQLAPNGKDYNICIENSWKKQL